MTCSNCGEPNHNIRGCEKSSMGKKDSSGKQQQASSQGGLQYEHISYSAPQVSQRSQGSPFAFMPTPRFQSQFYSSNDPDFEHPNFKNEEDPILRPHVVSEEMSRIERKEQLARAANRTVISFRDDKNGVST